MFIESLINEMQTDILSYFSIRLNVNVRVYVMEVVFFFFFYRVDVRIVRDRDN